MANVESLSALIESLTQSLSSAQNSGEKAQSLRAPPDGISLLDTKNELLLSYLHNLVFLILVKIRNAKSSSSKPSRDSSDENASQINAVTRKLVELRLFLERGVRPLEDKLQYQITNLLRAADDADRRQANAKASETNKASGEDESGSGDSDSDAEGSDVENSDSAEEDAKQLRPQLSRFRLPTEPDPKSSTATKSDGEVGVWRASRTRRVVMPTEDSHKKTTRRPFRSATMDEFVASELASAPMAEPSVGTTILAGGRKVKTAADRKREDERREYEEINLVRLPKESAKERKNKARAEGRSGRMEFGGEEWRDLGEGVNRIERLTRRKEGATGTRALLEKSRKRAFSTTDGPKQSGQIGDKFNKRLRTLENGPRKRSKR